jgi:UDP-glucuronate decarboxylase
LSAGHQVLVLDNFYTSDKANIQHLAANQNLEVIRHDVINPFIAEVDAIYHLACPASPLIYQQHPLETFKTSILGAINMLELAKIQQAKILQASTSEVYGDPEVHPQPETYHGNVNPIGTRACYDEGKRGAETLFFDYHRTYQLRIKVMRIFNTYGPRMSATDGRVVSNLIIQALKGQALTVVGDGKQTRSFCFIDDTVDAMWRLMNTHDTLTGPINVGNPSECTILDLANMILDLTGSKSTLAFLPTSADDPLRRQPLVDLAKKELSWTPNVSLKDGLIQTIAYFEKILK